MKETKKLCRPMKPKKKLCRLCEIEKSFNENFRRNQERENAQKLEIIDQGPELEGLPRGMFYVRDEEDQNPTRNNATKDRVCVGVDRNGKCILSPFERIASAIPGL